MSKRLRETVEQIIVKEGRAGKARICDALNKSERTLDRWIENGIPTQHDAYTLALAVGFSEEESLRIARE